jgi:hypothetical protein
MFKTIKIILYYFIYLHIVSYSYGAFLSNGFLVTSQVYTKEIKESNIQKCIANKKSKDYCICSIQIFYPKISSKNKDIDVKVNSVIRDFLESFTACETTSFPLKKIVKYQFPDSGFKNYFSIKFIKQDHDLALKQYGFTFDKKTGNLLKFFDIFIESEELKTFMIGSFGKDFAEKIKAGDFFTSIEDMTRNKRVQFYLQDSLIHMILNQKSVASSRIIDIIVPQNFIKINYAKF